MTADNGFSDFYYQSPDGLTLHARIYGVENEAALPVVCLPGLTRNARDFHEIALFLSREHAKPRKVVCFDYRGRGLSDYDPDWTQYNVLVESNDILAGLDALGIGKAAFIGTSRGGLILHVLAVLRPEILNAIVLNDIGAKIEADGLELIKAYLEDPEPVHDSFEEAAGLQEKIHGRAFTALEKADWLAMAHAVFREIDGVVQPDFDPALVNSLVSFDTSKPIPTLWPQFDAMANVPVMVIRGENSRLLSIETVAEMVRRHPSLVAVTAYGQGHAPFLHKNGLDARIAAFIDAAE